MGLTPLEPAPPGLVPGREIWLKREDVHELGAFKWRGALPALEGYQAAGATEVVAVAAKEAPVMALLYHLGHVAESDRSATFADGLAALPRLDVDGPIVLVVTGHNIDDGPLRRTLDEPGSFAP